MQHIRAGGDPADWLDISHWEALIGAGAGKKLTNQSDCGVPSKQPTPTTTGAATTTTTAQAPASSCDPGKGSVCVVYDGALVGSTSSPNLVGVAATTNVSWHLEWTSNPAGYGVPNTLAPSSNAKGTVTVKYNTGKTCSSPVGLIAANPPTLAQGFPASKTEVTIEVPNPAEVSTGTGSGYPSIGPTNGCPGLVGSMPANFIVKAPLHPSTTVKPADGGGPIAGPGKTGSYKLTGTISVIVG